MRVLVGCEFSGVVRDAFMEKGHEAYSCDLLDGKGRWPEMHIKGDVREVIHKDWDLAIFHPPCTFLCNSGVRWLHEDDKRWYDMVDGALFFKELLNAPIDRICVENPVMHQYAAGIVGVDYTQKVQPYDFGAPETKGTCLWLKNLPALVPTHFKDGDLFGEERPKEIEARIHHMPPSEDRGYLRSITYPEIANAMAEEWG